MEALVPATGKTFCTKGREEHGEQGDRIRGRQTKVNPRSSEQANLEKNKIKKLESIFSSQILLSLAFPEQPELKVKRAMNICRILFLPEPTQCPLDTIL